MNKNFNRPLSPHLTIYLPQRSSLLSIWHRISGVLLFLIIFLFILIQKLTLLIAFPLILFFQINYSYFLISFIGLVFFYHTINGVYHLMYDLN